MFSGVINLVHHLWTLLIFEFPLGNSNNTFICFVLVPTSETATNSVCNGLDTFRRQTTIISQILFYYRFMSWVSIVCSYIHSLWAGQSGDHIPVEARFSAPVQNSAEIHPASYTMGKAARWWRWPPTLIQSRSEKKKDTAIPLFPLCSFVTYSRVKFTFTFF